MLQVSEEVFYDISILALSFVHPWTQLNNLPSPTFSCSFRSDTKIYGAHSSFSWNSITFIPNWLERLLLRYSRTAVVTTRRHRYLGVDEEESGRLTSPNHIYILAD